MNTKLMNGPEVKHQFRGAVHCPICTHTVEAEVLTSRRGAFVKPGQSCPRCAAKLDAAYVLQLERAA